MSQSRTTHGVSSGNAKRVTNRHSGPTYNRVVAKRRRNPRYRGSLTGLCHRHAGTDCQFVVVHVRCPVSLLAHVLGASRGGKTGALPLGGAGLGPDYFAESRHSRRLFIKNSAWSRVRAHCSTVLSPEVSLAGGSSLRAITGGNGFRNSCSTTLSGITELSVPSTECRVNGSVIWCCLHALPALLGDTREVRPGTQCIAVPGLDRVDVLGVHRGVGFRVGR